MTSLTAHGHPPLERLSQNVSFLACTQGSIFFTIYTKKKYLLRLKENIFQRFYVKNIAPRLKLTAGNVAAFPGAAVAVHQLRENNQTYKVAIWYPHTLQTNIFNLLSERETIEGFKRIKFTLMTLCILDIVGKLLLFCKT